ncbi:ABC transporter substrate-binding protein, partial [Chloroflexota bacterium]
DHVSASSMTWVRNPNYWMNDPFFPENQLPYLDGFTFLIIPDLSTMLAALRTGRIDNIPTDGQGKSFSITRDDWQNFMNTNPGMEWTKSLGTGGGAICWRLDNPELPYHDVRVRRALIMAINNPELIDLYYDGDAEMLVYPISPVPAFLPAFTPLEEMPRSVQELYEYHPDKSRQLLAEAGYPAGFKAKIVCTPDQVDLLSVVKEYWADIGVDLELQVRNESVWESIGVKMTHEEMYLDRGGLSDAMTSSHHRKGGGSNISIVDEPFHPFLRIMWQERYNDSPARDAIYTTPIEELLPDMPEAKGVPSFNVYANEQVFYHYLPAPYAYIFWQPWLKGYYGANNLGYCADLGWPRYAWLDQDLKKAMGY